MLRVCIPRPPGDDFLRHLESELAGCAQIRDDDKDAAILVDGTPPDLDGMNELRAVIVPYAGVPARTRKLLTTRPEVSLHNLHHNAVPTAETAFALMLAAAKQVVPIDRALRADDWRPRYAPTRTRLLAGGKAVVLGFGAIGHHIGTLCRGLGMSVVGVTRAPKPPFPRCLDDAAALFVCVPWTPQTENMVDGAALATLPDHSIVVNVARGPVIEQASLFRELESGRLAAGLDVWWNYPKTEEDRAAHAPADFPFGTLDNVVLSPHRAGHCEGIERLRAQHLATLLRAAAAGDEIPNRVDLERGY